MCEAKNKNKMKKKNQYSVVEYSLTFTYIHQHALIFSSCIVGCVKSLARSNRSILCACVCVCMYVCVCVCVCMCVCIYQ